MEHMINRKIEEFHVSAYTKGDFTEVSQEDLMGHWSVLFFYPADFTFVCPTELGDLAEHYEEFKKEGCEIYSVSEDTHFVHKAWADASETIKKIQYVMLADPAGELARQFGVLVEKEGQALRGTFILNPEGVVKAYEYRQRSLWRSTETRYARPNGSPERRP